MQKNRKLFLLAFCISLLLFYGIDSDSTRSEANLSAPPPYSVHIGVILYLNSPMGRMADACLSKAHSDFYAEYSDYKTRLFLQTINAEEELEVSSAASELLKHKEVHGVMGPELSTEATFVQNLEQKHVPVISFTAKSQSFFPRRDSYFIRTTPDDSHQAKALAAICEGFEWHEVVILYEDTEYGNQFLSKLNKAFQEGDIRLAYMSAISISAKDTDILKELKKLKTFKNRVFLVHMTAYLGCRLFVHARNAEMMNEGYVWLITDSLSNFLYSVDLTCTESMEGALGIRPHVPRSKKLEKFRAWWKKFALGLKPDTAVELNVYGLWAYDTVWALGLAAEKILPLDADFSNSSQIENGKNLSNLSVSLFGPKLLSELLHTNFGGLTGEFKLVNGRLQPSAFEIFNMIGTGDKTVGYWIPGKGISRKLAGKDESAYSTSIKEIKAIIWPGDTVVKPSGWAIPSTGKLRIGVPNKGRFTEFVNVQIDPLTNETKFGGLSIDIFLESLEFLPFNLNYELIPYTFQAHGDYEDMLQKIVDKSFDFVICDITIVAYRSTYMDFTLPFTESGIGVVVRNENRIDMWLFLKPLRWDLWLAIIITCILMGIVLKMLEQKY